MIAATNGWAIALDNVSDLRTWLSNALCRLATGGGFKTRALYTDDEEQVFDAMRPVVTTGIAAVADAPDLLDRALLITQPVILKHERRREEAIWRDFERVRRRVLGALLDAVVVALGRVDAVELGELPRMADFAAWVEAAAPAFGWERGTFLAAYNGNRGQVHELALDSFPIAEPVRAVAAAGFAGTAAELLQALTGRFDEKDPRRRELPKNTLGKQLRRIAPNLRHVGVAIEFEREAGGSRERGVYLSATPDEYEGGNSCPSCPTRPNPSARAGSAEQERDGRDTSAPPRDGSRDGRSPQGVGANPHSGAVRDTWDTWDRRTRAHTSWGSGEDAEGADEELERIRAKFGGLP